MKKTVGSILALMVVLLPAIALAQGGASDGFGDVTTFIGRISTFINGTLIPLVFAIALLVFLYGVFKYFILGGGEAEKREEGVQLMLYAIAGFVIMVSIWGIVNMLAGGLFGSTERDNIQNIPNVPTSNTN